MYHVQPGVALAQVGRDAIQVAGCEALGGYAESRSAMKRGKEICESNSLTSFQLFCVWRPVLGPRS
jgi:hypothetical protein